MLKRVGGVFRLTDRTLCLTESSFLQEEVQGPAALAIPDLTAAMEAAVAVAEAALVEAEGAVRLCML